MPKIFKPQNEFGNTLVDITKIGYNNDNQFNEDFINIETEIKSEEEARTKADSILKDNIDAEVSRAQEVENEFNTRITTLETNKPTIISVPGQTITNPTEITMGE